MKIIGHRGAKGLAPENTLAGLRQALEHGVDMVEFDVRVTKDGVPVLHHDKAITDPDGRKLKLRSYDCQELKSHSPSLITLQEALTFIDESARPYVEVKPGEPVQPVAAVLKKFSGAQNLLLGSKSQRTLRELHEKLPAVEKIVIEPFSGLRAQRRARQVGATRLSMQQRWLWWGFIRAFKNSRYQLYAYTVNDPQKARRWAKWGLAGVITDYPDRFDK